MFKNSPFLFWVIISTIFAWAGTVIPQPSPSQVATVDFGNATRFYNGPSVARSSTGKLVVVWETGSNYNNEIYWSAYQNGNWLKGESLSDQIGGGDNTGTPAIVADNLGNIHSVWKHQDLGLDPSNPAYSYTRIYYSRYNGTNWTTPIDIQGGASDKKGSDPSIVVGSDGTIWVAYHTFWSLSNPKGIFVVKSTNNGTTWSSPVELAPNITPGVISNQNCRPMLAAGLNGKVFATFREDNTVTSGYTSIYICKYAGGNWSDPIFVTPSGSSRNYDEPSIAIDPSGRIHIIYDSDEIYYTYSDNEGASWSEPILISSQGDANARRACISADDNGGLYVAWYQGSATVPYRLYYRTSSNRGISWSPIVDLPNANWCSDVCISTRIWANSPGADVLWTYSTGGSPDGFAVMYGRIPLVTVSVDDNTSKLKSQKLCESSILQSYPNPFSTDTKIQFTIIANSKVNLSIYNTNGQLVKNLIDGELSPGLYTSYWNGENEYLKNLASGNYFCILRINDNSRISHKMILLK